MITALPWIVLAAGLAMIVGAFPAARLFIGPMAVTRRVAPIRRSEPGRLAPLPLPDRIIAPVALPRRLGEIPPAPAEHRARHALDEPRDDQAPPPA